MPRRFNSHGQIVLSIIMGKRSSSGILPRISIDTVQKRRLNIVELRQQKNLTLKENDDRQVQDSSQLNLTGERTPHEMKESFLFTFLGAIDKKWWLIARYLEENPAVLLTVAKNRIPYVAEELTDDSLTMDVCSIFRCSSGFSIEVNWRFYQDSHLMSSLLPQRLLQQKLRLAQLRICWENSALDEHIRTYPAQRSWKIN